MKKTTLLSLVTAATVVATSAGTFAVWDQMSASKELKVKFDAPVTTTLSGTDFTLDARVYGNTQPTATTSLKVNIDNMKDVTDYKLQVTTPQVSGLTVSPVADIPLVEGKTEYTIPVTVTATDSATAGSEQAVTVNVEITK